MRHFLFEEREYRYRADFRRSRQVRDPVVELARLFRRKGATSRPKPRPKDLRQKCIAKMQYSNSIEAHHVQLEKYLIREGAGLDGKVPELFGTDNEEYRKNMVPKNFRVFLSPESVDIDLVDLTEQFVKKLEKQTGYQVYWQGACHYNTAHPHAHLLINGVDKQGKEIHFPKDIVKTFMRETARDLCTAQAGSRTWKDLEREKEQALTASRYTKLDDKIQDLSDGSKVTIGKHTYDRERLLVRLDTLRKLNLCSYVNGAWVLKKDWQEDLRTNGRYNVYLKAREELKYTDPSLMKIYTGEQGFITGKVTKIYRTDDDASDNHAVVLEGIDGKAYFVPLLKKPEIHDGKNKALLKEGELVSIKAYQSQRGRLTPLFFSKDIRSIKKEIRKNNHSGALSDEVLKTKGGIWNANKNFP